jgi:hypothetical protein
MIWAKWWFDYLTRNINWDNVLWDIKWRLVPQLIDWVSEVFK